MLPTRYLAGAPEGLEHFWVDVDHQVGGGGQLGVAAVDLPTNPCLEWLPHHRHEDVAQPLPREPGYVTIIWQVRLNLWIGLNLIEYCLNSEALIMGCEDDLDRVALDV